MNNLSWYLTLNINNLKTLFSQENLPYEVDCYLCSCSHKEIIMKNRNDILDEFECKNCQNKLFYNANKYHSNSLWYQQLNSILDNEFLSNIEAEIIIDEENNLKSFIGLKIPISIDLASEEIIYTTKKIFEVEINKSGNIKDNLFVNLHFEELKSYREKRDEAYFNVHIEENILINRHHLVKIFKNRILEKLKTFYLFEKINHFEKIISFEEVAFFYSHSFILDYEFYYWKNIELLPTHNMNLLNGLQFILNYRKEKSLKKAVFLDYKKQLEENKAYYFTYVYCITRLIKDVNIAKRMIELDFSYHLEILDESFRLYEFINFLLERFNEKQIENIFKGYLKNKNERFWLIDSINLYSELKDEIYNLTLSKANYITIHDQLGNFQRRFTERAIFDMTFEYEKKYINACYKIEDYEIYLPNTGNELYEWAEKLENCLFSYGFQIKDRRTTIYGFFIDNEIKFAIEIKNKKIVQARKKFNKTLSTKENDLVDNWFKKELVHL